MCLDEDCKGMSEEKLGLGGAAFEDPACVEVRPFH